MMMKLRATRPFRYNTRALVAGEEFEARPRDARLLLAIRKATAVRPPADVPPPPAVKAKIEAAVAPPRKPTTFIEEPYAGESPPPAGTAPAPHVGAMTTTHMGGTPSAPQVDDDLLKARADYRDAFGKPADARWSTATVRSKIAEKDSAG